jgi:hypothetical protein
LHVLILGWHRRSVIAHPTKGVLMRSTVRPHLSLRWWRLRSQPWSAVPPQTRARLAPAGRSRCPRQRGRVRRTTQPPAVLHDAERMRDQGRALHPAGRTAELLLRLVVDTLSVGYQSTKDAGAVAVRWPVRQSWRIV